MIMSDERKPKCPGADAPDLLECYAGDRARPSRTRWRPGDVLLVLLGCLVPFLIGFGAREATIASCGHGHELEELRAKNERAAALMRELDRAHRAELARVRAALRRAGGVVR